MIRSFGHLSQWVADWCGWKLIEDATTANTFTNQRPALEPSAQHQNKAWAKKNPPSSLFRYNTPCDWELLRKSTLDKKCQAWRSHVSTWRHHAGTRAPTTRFMTFMVFTLCLLAQGIVSFHSFNYFNTSTYYTIWGCFFFFIVFLDYNKVWWQKKYDWKQEYWAQIELSCLEGLSVELIVTEGSTLGCGRDNARLKLYIQHIDVSALKRAHLLMIPL